MDFIACRRKGQAAVEFLMTYSWAILVVIAAIAALAYFGVLNPDKFLPDKCVLIPGLSCIDHSVEKDKITLLIGNGLGNQITVTSIDISGCNSTYSQQMDPGAQYSFIIGGSCTNGASKDNFKSEIKITYADKDSGLSKTAYGDLNTKIN